MRSGGWLCHSRMIGLEAGQSGFGDIYLGSRQYFLLIENILKTPN